MFMLISAKSNSTGGPLTHTREIFSPVNTSMEIAELGIDSIKFAFDEVVVTMVVYWLTSKNSFFGTMSCHVSPVFASKTKGSLSLVKVFCQIVLASSVERHLLVGCVGEAVPLPVSVPLFGLSTSEGVVGLLPSAYDGCW